ncbi:MAG: Rpn family recombination-promoting nuclease/putative transposase [Succinivibrio sp.]|nr:Rpn family recombination-promoting nuclease/putative transposase [Succinivibrio sp.]
MANDNRIDPKNRTETPTKRELDEDAINFLNDPMFKHNFGSRERSHITIDFLNSVLDGDGFGTITSIEFQNTVVEPDHADRKVIIVDIVCTTDRGEQIDIEVQVLPHHYFAERILTYWSKLFLREIHRGDSYKKVKRTLIITILAEKLLPNQNYHSRYFVYNPQEQHKLTDVFCLHFLEIKKVEVEKPISQMTPEEKWLAVFSRKLSMEQKKRIAQSREAIDEMMSEARAFLQDEDHYLSYLLAEEAERTYRTDMAASLEEGIEIGQKQGRVEERDENVIKMHRENISKTIISKISGYSIEKIEEIIAAEQHKNSKGADDAVPAATPPQDHGAYET